MVAYRQTSVLMKDAEAAIRTLDFPAAVKRAAYVVFRIESGNGGKGVNNNYVGAQADGSRWPASVDHLFTGVVVRKENKTEKVRLFLAFADVGGCLTFLCDRLQARGLFVGPRLSSPDALATAYYREWVTGVAGATMPAAERAGFLSMYHQAEGLFA